MLTQKEGVIVKTLDTKSYADIKRINPEAKIRVYRGIPADVKGRISPGDFIAADKEIALFYARDLIRRGVTTAAKITSKTVKAKELKLHPAHQAQGVENEFIYNPEKPKGRYSMQGSVNNRLSNNIVSM